MGGILFASTGSSTKLNAVWTTGDYSTISGPTGSGSQSGHTAGFSLLTEDGQEVWHASYPGDHSACGSTDYGHTFSLTGGCFAEGQEFHFNCWSESTTPSKCSVRDKDENNLALGDGQDNTNFIGIAISIDGYCGAAWDLGDVDCQPGAEGFTATYLE